MPAPVRDEETWGPLRAWVDAATSYFLGHIVAGDMTVPRVARTSIVRDPSGTSTAVHAVSRHSWSTLVQQRAEEVKRLKAYASLLEHAGRSEAIRAFLLTNSPGQDLSTEFILDLLLFGVICDPLLTRCLELSVALGKAYVDRSTIESIYAELEAQVHGAPARWRAIVPLWRVMAPDQFDMELSPSLRIRSATDVDRERWLSASDVHGAGGSWVFALRTDCVVEVDESVEVGHRPDFARQVRSLLTGLRLLDIGSLAVPCMVVGRVDAWVEERWEIEPFSTARAGLGGLGLAFGETERERFARFWKWYASATADVPAPLEIALVRVERAASDNPIEDRLIDCCVGFDALLGAGTMQELTYTVRMRGAFLLGADDDDRRRVFELLGGLYRARGSIIHGGRRPQEAIDRVLRNATFPTTADIFIQQVVSLLARLVRAMLSLKDAKLADGAGYSFVENEAGAALDDNVISVGHLRGHFSEWV